MKQVIYEKEIPTFLLPYLESQEMQRLQDIDMNCGMNYTSIPLFQGIESYTRYTHSISVALIIYHYTQNPVQTLAGLFHDIATPAFSHVIDFLHGDALTQESTEDKTHQIIAHSKQIISLLEKDHISINQVDDYHLYPIADNDTPMLSSDRLEYTFSAAIDYHFGTAEEFQEIYDDIVPSTNEKGEVELVFQHAQYAKRFAEIALRNGKVFSSQEDRCCMELLARFIRQAITENILKEEDLYLTEPIVIKKIEESKLAPQWQEFKKIREVTTSHEEKEGWIQVAAKKRYVDPYCLETKSRISNADEDIARRIRTYKMETNQEWMKGCK